MNKMTTLLITAILTMGLQASAALNFDASVPANIKSQMTDDLAFMSTLQGSAQSPYHKQIFGNLSGASYKTFFESRIQTVGMNACGGGMAVACVIPFSNPNKMWLTQNFVKFSHPQIARLMVVYHESRHSETKNDNWPHDDCPTPFLDAQGKDMASIWTGAKLEGQPACDSTPFGSYGSSTILLKNVAKYCTNCTDKVKMDADMYATDQLGRIDSPTVKTSMLADFNAQAQ
jgi:hypothetical protein